MTKNYYQVHREMVKDIIIAYDEFFAKNISLIGIVKAKEFNENRLSEKQRKYIRKIVTEYRL